MIADALIIGNTPILLLDEIENAGIFKDRVMQAIRGGNKAVVLVTHDPYLALTADKRIVMRNGGVYSVVEPTCQEQDIIEDLALIQTKLNQIREKIRLGTALSSGSSEALMIAVGQGVARNEASHNCRSSKWRKNCRDSPDHKKSSRRCAALLSEN